MKKSTAQKRMSVEEQIKTLENQRRQYIRQEKEEAEQERMKRVRNRGIFIEKTLPHLTNLTQEQFEAFIEKALLSEQTQRIFTDISSGKSTPQSPKSVEPVEEIAEEVVEDEEE